MDGVLHVVLLLAVTFLSETIPAVETKNEHDRIVGGENADITNYPYQASLTYKGSHICGASVISDRWLLTAAHCAAGDVTTSLMGLRLGSSLRTSGGNLYKVSRKILHPKYNPTTADYDFCLLQTSTKIAYGDSVQPIKMAAANYRIPVGALATVTGFGLTKENGKVSPILQVVNVPVWSQAECRATNGQLQTITDAMFCAGLAEGGQDSCQGDSGGPCVVDDVQVGVVSWGQGCARPGNPGVYARVSSARTWIDSYVSPATAKLAYTTASPVTAPSTPPTTSSMVKLPKATATHTPHKRKHNPAITSVDAPKPECKEGRCPGAASGKTEDESSTRPVWIPCSQSSVTKHKNTEREKKIHSVFYFYDGNDVQHVVNISSSKPWSALGY